MKKVRSLNTKTEFERLSLPLPESGEEQLLQDILCNGCLDPITVWHGVILDGHKRYRICCAEGIGFAIRELQFAMEEEAIAWICRQRIRHLRQDSLQYRYLVGEWVSCELRRNRAGTVKPEKVTETVAREIGIHPSTVRRYREFARAMDILADKEPQLFHAVMAGEITSGYQRIVELTRADDRRRRENLKILSRKAARTKQAMREKQKPAEPEFALSIGIKEMPAYDPDMELKGLILTVPTWIGMMDRAMKRSKIDLVTAETKGRLRQTLRRMQEQINLTMEGLK